MFGCLYPYFLDYCRSAYPHLHVHGQLKTVANFSIIHNMSCFEGARRLRRHFVYYAGAANTGKTYAALKSFESAQKAVYCGPLRLLANEVYERVNSNGTVCNLVTGQLRDYRPGAGHVSCTIEMVDLEREYQVAVIDEIQMLGHADRGWAWTTAVMGLKAERVYVCGDPSGIPLMRRLLAHTGEAMEVRQRVGSRPLVVEPSCLGSYSRETLQHGDCVVSFSRKELFEIARQLRKQGIDFSLIYGDLPNNVKVHEAIRFNAGNKVLLATDAIGMGLNLSIRRVIFNSMRRHREFLSPAEVKQIAGRAARLRSKYDGQDAKVMALGEDDHKTLPVLIVSPVLRSPPPPSP